MRNLITFIAVVLTIGTFFTSCQEDSELIGENTQPTETKTKAPEGAGETFELLTDVTDFEKKELEAEFEQTADFNPTEGAVELDLKKEEGLESRGSISCGNRISGNNFYGFNNFSTYFYQANGLSVGSNLDGRDDYFDIYVDREVIVNFELTGTSTNMAMMLFDLNVSCPPGIMCVTSMDNVTSFSQIKIIGYTRSSSPYSDNIRGVVLKPGVYSLIVDAPAGAASSYRLQMNCTPTGGGGGGWNDIQYGDNFNGYYTGNISPQSSSWTKWTNANRDGRVVGSYDKELYIAADPYASSSTQPDVLYRLRNHNNDFYNINFELYVDRYRSAYFNLQKMLTYNNSNNEFGAQVYFNSDGTGRVTINGRSYSFSYSQGRWIGVRAKYDFNSGTASITIGGRTVANFNPYWRSGSSYGSGNLQAVNFYAHRSDARYWVDNIVVTNY